jgi:ribosomal-protein-alanine N-acetyltransferase
MLETERLLFRKFTLNDLDWLVCLRADIEVARFLGGVHRRSDVETRLRWYLECYEKHGFGYCVMIYKETGQEIGWSGLQPLDDTGEIELGYGMMKEYWGRGIGTEACKGWLEFGFNKLELERITAIAIPQNTPSRRIMEKAGMQYEKNISLRGYDLAMHALSRENFIALNEH